jgi:predicted MFS family arabinose efflux permease
MVLVIAGCAMIAVTEWLPADWQAAWIVAGYVVMYSGIPVYFVNGPPFLINASAPDQRSRVISVQIATWSIAAFAGSLVGGFLPGAIAQALGVSLDSPTPYRIPMMLTTFLLVIPLVCIMATREEASSQSTERVAEDGPTPVKLISVLTLVRLLQVGAIGTTSPFFNVYMDSALGVATATIGILAALGRLMAAPAALITPRLAARWGNRATIIWGSTAVALSILPLALIPTPWAAGLGYIGVIGLSSIRYSAFLTFMMNAVGPSRRAMMTGLTEASTGVSFAATSIASGYVITNYGYAPLFLAGGALSTVGTLVFWAYFRDKDVEKGVPG